MREWNNLLRELNKSCSCVFSLVRRSASARAPPNSSLKLKVPLLSTDNIASCTGAPRDLECNHARWGDAADAEEVQKTCQVMLRLGLICLTIHLTLS
mmetsp:Transcript_143282/g.260689  ORF Transcript_143282/g.260689 Transcript_143282/m.260689 type:complete len:97 (-) Transcript_143282:7-297(-)